MHNGIRTIRPIYLTKNKKKRRENLVQKFDFKQQKNSSNIVVSKEVRSRHSKPTAIYSINTRLYWSVLFMNSTNKLGTKWTHSLCIHLKLFRTKKNDFKLKIRAFRTEINRLSIFFVQSYFFFDWKYHFENSLALSNNWKLNRSAIIWIGHIYVRHTSW